MTLEEKVGQVIQADIASVTPEEVAEYNLGSVLNGGNSAPFNDNHTAPENWLDLADAFWTASTDRSDGGVGIPVIWGVDAVHGHNNIVGATLFPHNIGLGAANDADLIRRIGAATATEIRVTGNDWTFAPTVAVAQNDRWGRTYESYAEIPSIVSKYSAAMVEGLQGKVNSDVFLDQHHVISTVKHFVGDGSTVDGVDQGDSQVTEEELRDIHAAGYPSAIQAGVQVAMASYNSWHGQKMHGFKPMLSDVLVDRMGFDGFVVGDWNGHGQVAGCTPQSCAQAFNAGLDMFMAPDSWKALYSNVLEQVRTGIISESRLDQAVSRILRVKMRAGIFEAGLPSERPYAGDWSVLGSAEHRALAREAVRKSLVLIKNNNQLLPLLPSSKVVVAGSGADDIAQAAGGWTLTWQGSGNTNAHFPNGQSIYAGIAEYVEANGGQIEFTANGTFSGQPDVAIVVFGEQPYAEFQGDIANVDFADEHGLELLAAFRQAGIPTVSVFLSGRPLWVNPELNLSDAFVAAWLPGSEGGGVADMLFATADGQPRYDFSGRLSFSWPADPSQALLNIQDENYSPLFPVGYGLSIHDDSPVMTLNEQVESALATDFSKRYLYAGDAVPPWQLVAADGGGSTVINQPRMSSVNGALEVVATDHNAQEDTVIVTWAGAGSLSIQGETIDIARQSNGDMALELVYQVLKPASGNISLGMYCTGPGCAGNLDLTAQLNKLTGQGWQRSAIKLSCFEQMGADMNQITRPLVIESTSGLQLQIAEAHLVANQGQASCSL
ncbi:glycoside hydrolase family 3 protein [Alteromonas aestuariivivens]|uniref:Glycoside hydrolase family 3 protein n=2 Tax=Alteromonas aestuariivivens TaxID=1938339 RepID=A0A3D8M7Y9_9ALTE|nr:glycoside hydrolase family 3 protein [Alteromonas aestuariivivens]